MPQTKFVIEKALEAELKPIVVINKIDKPGARIKEVEDELADLFLSWPYMKTSCITRCTTPLAAPAKPGIRRPRIQMQMQT